MIKKGIKQLIYKPVFTSDKTFILHCQADWRAHRPQAAKEEGLAAGPP